MREIEKEVAARFAQDVANHVMTVEMDNGVHRCLHFGRPGSGVHSFRLVTWPGHLYIGGDCDDFVFRRLTDMFEFFRSDRGRVNLSYWAEKLTAASARGGYEEYSERMFREAIEQRVTEWIDGEELSEEQIAKLREQVADEVMSCASDGEQAAPTLPSATYLAQVTSEALRTARKERQAQLDSAHKTLDAERRKYQRLLDAVNASGLNYSEWSGELRERAPRLPL